MRTRTLFLGVGSLVGWVAYGCGGESVTRYERGPRAGAGSGARAGSGVATKGGASPGARGGSGGARAGKGGSAGGADGLVDGGATSLGGTAGDGGRSPRGGTGGDAPGGAGSDGMAGSCLVMTGGAGETTYDRCCLGDAWGDTFEYYALESADCGEPRTCTVSVGSYQCQDIREYVHMDTTCCGDGRWHVLSRGGQLEEANGEPIDSQLSPPCGGTALPSSHALHFDGASYLELPIVGPPDYYRPVLELWFRTSSASGSLLSSTATAHRLYLSGGKLCFSPGEDGGALCTSESAFADGAWHHAAFAGGAVGYPDVTYGGLYADGTLRVPGAAQHSSAVITQLHAGYGPTGDASVSEYFVGDLDEIRIWGEPRHPYDIVDYYTTRLTHVGMQRRMLGYFPLEESGPSATTQNLALVDVPRNCLGEPPSGYGGEGGAGPEQPDATLVGFSSVTSPWLTPGAF